jgi:GNAT superfamily N-acetyltransferase
MLEIRKARPADIDVILEFIHGLAAYENYSHGLEVTAEGLGLALFGEQRSAYSDIAEIDGNPVGFALWIYTFSTYKGNHGIYLEDIFVKDAQRGQGIGKALLARLARRCVEENLGRLEWSVLDWNAPAIAFYRSRGARLLENIVRCRVDGAELVALGA